MPKEIVRSRYVFDIECYIRQYILKSLQEQHLSTNSDMCIMREYSNGKQVLFPPSIDDLYKKEVHGTIHKNYALKESLNNYSVESHFMQDMLSRIKHGYGALSDTQLDEIVYGSKQMSA